MPYPGAKDGDLNSNSKWVNSLHDDAAGVVTLPACVTLADLHGDGDTKLIIAHIGARYDMKLRVFKGLTPIASNVLADVPVAIVAFINEQSTLPSVAVASGASLLIYKSLKPFYKFTVPSAAMHPVEVDAWSKAGQQELSHEDLFAVVQNLASAVSPKNLTSISQTLLITPEQHRSQFIEKYSQKPLTNPAPITCLATMKKSTADQLDVLICGTEKGAVLAVDSQAFTTTTSVQLNDTPTQIVPFGMFDVDYRLFVSTRSSHIYSIKRGVASVSKPIITCKSDIVGFVRINKMLAVACSDHSLSFYSFKGKRLNNLLLDGPIRTLEPFYYAPKQFSGVLVMMKDQIRLYSDQFLLDVIRVDRNLQWIRFGQFGREEGALLMGTKEGGIMVRLFRRRASLEEKMDLKPHPQAHNLKLNIPKKTRAFIDETLRERDHAVHINQMYQKDLFLLRYGTTAAFAAMSSSSLATVSTDDNEAVDISVDVNGFGPTFRMTVFLNCATKTPLHGMWLSFVGGEGLYRFSASLIPVSILTPGDTYTYTTMVECTAPEKGLSEDIRVLLIREGRRNPIVTAIVAMPVSEISLLD